MIWWPDCSCSHTHYILLGSPLSCAPLISRSSRLQPFSFTAHAIPLDRTRSCAQLWPCCRGKTGCLRSKELAMSLQERNRIQNSPSESSRSSSNLRESRALTKTPKNIRLYIQKLRWLQSFSKVDSLFQAGLS